jgi:uncharacterized protein YukE
VAGRGVVSDHKAMSDAVTGFDEAAANVKKAAGDLETELAEDTKRYHGEQAAAFKEMHLMLQEDLTTARKQLDLMSTSVHKSLTGYTTEDTHAADRMKKLRKKGAGAISSRLAGH